MLRAGGIEGLSIFFTAGVAAACILVRGTVAVFLPLLFSTSLLPAILLLWLHRSKASTAILFFLLYFILGFFCYVSNAFSFNSGGPFSSWQGSERLLERLCALIDSIDFSSPGASGSAYRNGALIKALLTGVRADMDPSVKEAFRNSGASHILALSGLHLGVLYGLLSKVLSLLFNTVSFIICASVPGASNHGRIFSVVKAVLCVCLCGMYSVVTGAGPSIIRAFLFICLNELSKLQRGRRRSPRKILCAALLIQLGLAPSVITSSGFQLSYLAMCGIVFLYPLMERWSELRLWKMMALSISCQLFTAPLVLLRFGTFPKYFLLTNLLAMPLSEALMLTSVAALPLSALNICPAFLPTISGFFSDLLIRVLETISTM